MASQKKFNNEFRANNWERNVVSKGNNATTNNVVKPNEQLAPQQPRYTQQVDMVTAKPRCTSVSRAVGVSSLAKGVDVASAAAAALPIKPVIRNVQGNPGAKENLVQTDGEKINVVSTSSVWRSDTVKKSSQLDYYYLPASSDWDAEILANTAKGNAGLDSNSTNMSFECNLREDCYSHSSDWDDIAGNAGSDGSEVSVPTSLLSSQSTDDMGTADSFEDSCSEELEDSNDELLQAYNSSASGMSFSSSTSLDTTKGHVGKEKQQYPKKNHGFFEWEYTRAFGDNYYVKLASDYAKVVLVAEMALKDYLSRPNIVTYIENDVSMKKEYSFFSKKFCISVVSDSQRLMLIGSRAVGDYFSRPEILAHLKDDTILVDEYIYFKPRYASSVKSLQVKHQQQNVGTKIIDNGVGSTGETLENKKASYINKKVLAEMASENVLRKRKTHFLHGEVDTMHPRWPMDLEVWWMPYFFQSEPTN